MLGSHQCICTWYASLSAQESDARASTNMQRHGLYQLEYSSQKHANGPWIPRVYPRLSQWESSPKGNNEMFLLGCIISTFWKSREVEVEEWLQGETWSVGDAKLDAPPQSSDSQSTHTTHLNVPVTHDGIAHHQIVAPPPCKQSLKLAKQLQLSLRSQKITKMIFLLK